MAKVISRNQPNHATKYNFPVPVIDYKTEYATAKDEPDSVELTNVLTPLDAPTHVRFAIQNIANVYKQGDISAENRLPVTKGVSLMIGKDEIWTVTDSEDPSYQKQFPVSGHLVLKVPTNGMVTSTDLLSFILDILAGLGLQSGATSGRVDALLRGALNPRS